MLQRIVSLDFKDKVARFFGFQSNDEVRQIIMHLPVVQVRNCKSKARVFDEGLNSRTLINMKCGRLFPLPRVCNDIVEMTFLYFKDFTTSPKVYVCS